MRIDVNFLAEGVTRFYQFEGEKDDYKAIIDSRTPRKDRTIHRIDRAVTIICNENSKKEDIIKILTDSIEYLENNEFEYL